MNARTFDHPDDPAHLAVCALCQAEARRHLDGVDLGRVWTRVAAEMWSPATGRVERFAARLLGSPGLARALVTTPSLVSSWLGATAVVLLVGAIATRQTGAPWIALLAPALAGAGIAYAYGPGIDPAFELSRSMAVSDRLVLIVRALAVFGFNAALGLGAMLIADQANALTLGWLAPMTAVAALALAIAVRSGSPNAGVAGALGAWALVVLSGEAARGDPGAAVALTLAPVYLVLAILLTIVALHGLPESRKGTPRWSV